MKTQKTVYNKLSKIVKPSEQKEELSAEKVELSFEGDKDKFVTQAKAAFNAVDDATDKYRKAVDEIREVQKEVLNARKMLDKITSNYGKAEKAFRDVGIEPPSYLGLIDGKIFSAWENDLIDSKQILEQYVKG